MRGPDDRRSIVEGPIGERRSMAIDYWGRDRSHVVFYCDMCHIIIVQVQRKLFDVGNEDAICARQAFLPFINNDLRLEVHIGIRFILCNYPML